MTRPLLLVPHHDDETLFASAIVMRYHPDIVTCFTSHKQTPMGVDSATREGEQEDAIIELTPGFACYPASYATWLYTDTLSKTESYAALAPALVKFEDDYRPSHVFAPAIENGGHEQHNGVGLAALDVFGIARVTGYMTYRRGYTRTTSEHEHVLETDEVVAKLRALACYRSQIGLKSTRPWFTGDQREYLLAPIPDHVARA